MTVRSQDEWLNQGDVFAAVPIPTSRLANGRVEFGTRAEAPAVLLTDDCILDKRSNGHPSFKHLNFAPLWSLQEMRYDERKRSALRAGELNPADPVYLNLDGFVDSTEEPEAIALLSQTFWLPERYFDLHPMEDETDCTDGYRHKISRRRTDTRRCTMEPSERRLLQEKLAFFWIGVELDPVCSVCLQACGEVSGGSWAHLDRALDGLHAVELTASFRALIRGE